jgi:hypothetical protein
MLVCKALCFEACFAIVVYVWPFRVVLDESSISHRTNRSRDTATGYQVSINRNLKVVFFTDHLRQRCPILLSLWSYVADIPLVD